MFVRTRGLVLREVPYKESDKILTLLTEEQGKITVKARGARRKNSPLSAATQQLTYSEFTLFESRGRWTVNEAEAAALFPELREDLDKLALGCYFAQVLEQTGDEDQPTPGLLRLGLNALYALGKLPRPAGLIKAAFELKALALSGYQPDLEACRVCGGEPRDPWFSLTQGVVSCGEHRQGEGPWLALTPGVLHAMEHVLWGEEKRLFSFALEPEDLARFGEVCEGFLLRQLDRRFSTLDFWKSLPG